jgi:Zn finger protein HypA/HybF involved in hydrogenase expression
VSSYPPDAGTALDGNSAGGALAAVFAFEATTAVVTCASCHQANPMATLDAYGRGPGLVLRCPSCHEVQVRLVSSPTRAWLDVRGVELIEIPPPPGG